MSNKDKKNKAVSLVNANQKEIPEVPEMNIINAQTDLSKKTADKLSKSIKGEKVIEGQSPIPSPEEANKAEAERVAKEEYEKAKAKKENADMSFNDWISKFGERVLGKERMDLLRNLSKNGQTLMGTGTSVIIPDGEQKEEKEDQEDGNGEGEPKVETPIEEPSKNDEGTTVPETKEVIKEVIKEVPIEKEVVRYVNNPEVFNKANLIRRGIWADYSNGLFGDDDTKGIPYDKLTPEQKKRRNQALSLAWRYTLDNIGTMLWNIGSAFGRKDTFIDNEYTKLLRKQNENLVQNDTDLMKVQKEFELKLSQSKQFNNMTPLDQQAYLTFLMLDPSANKDNLLSARNLEQFEKYKLEIESNAVKASYLGNDKMQATIKNLIKDLDVKNADINKINADISRIAVENKLTEQQIQQILLECEAMQKRIGYIDAHEIADIVGKYGQFANDVTGSVANVINAFKPALNINKTTRTSPKVTQSTTEKTVNETTKKN